jgi:predicted RNase H-like HicB family nuclease
VRQVILYPGEHGYWVVERPSLPGSISQGKTKEEAVRNIREAIEGYVLTLPQDGLPIPAGRLDAGLLAV